MKKYILLIPLLLACGIVQVIPPVVSSVNTEIHTNTLPTAPSAEPTDAPQYGITQGDPLNIRACADTECEVIGNYPKGSKVELQAGTIKGDGSCSGWWTTSKGFICSDFVEVVK